MSLLGRLRARFHGSLRFKLLALALLPLGIVMPLLIAILASWSSVYYERLLIGKIRSDLAVAHGYFEQVKDGVGRRVEALAASERLARALREPPAKLPALLREARAQIGVDFLLLLDAEGRVRAASQNPYAGPGFKTIPPSQPGHTSIKIMSPGQLAAIDPQLAGKSHTPFVATPNARPTQDTEEGRGMIVQGSSPTTDGGTLIGGLLLNKNLAFVDRINEIVYPAGALPLGSKGTATLFLDDVRIATNVRLFEGERAIGTRVSATVRHAVLDEGRTWLDRAFVVNDWYVSAYEPIVDEGGQRVGMLYVGFLEAPFQEARQLALGAMALLFLLAAGVAAVVSLRLAGHVAQPVAKLHGVMNAIETGREEARVGRIEGADELAELGAHFDRLLDRLAEQTEALQRWGVELDGKVAERTRELAAVNESLRSAQQRLIMSEKLAAIGQLAAGVAHEVNNPVAVIQGNLDVLRETLGPAAAPVLPEMRLIQDQVFRIRLIVTKLLQFARPAEYAGYMEAVQVDQVVQDSLLLVQHHLKKARIAVVLDLRARQAVTVNRNELQQVLINLMVNALQAMSAVAGAALTLATGESTRDGIAGAFLAVADNGPGIAAADRERLFDPFFTTKTQDGTGLGLWVSLGLVQRYGGRIGVDCPPSGGSVFTVWLPLEPLA